MKFSFLILSMIGIIGCGVKGDPKPPTKPPHLGRGEPTFKEAVKDVKPVDVKELNGKEENEDENN